jgi:hypothetical protein
LAKCGANIVALSRTKSDLDSLQDEVGLFSKPDGILGIWDN